MSPFSVLSDFWGIIVYLGVCSALVAGCFCGDPYGYAEGDPRAGGFADAWAWFVSIKIPALAVWAVRACLPGRVSEVALRKAEDAKTYVCFKPNPLVQIFYLGVVFGGIYMFIAEAYPYIPNPRMHAWHKYTGYVAMASALVSFVVASTTPPGKITKKTVSIYDHFPYDDFLYVRRACKTCKTPKLARSKHCSICGYCVPKFDHHCPWINNCVGERNHKHFMAFLFANAFLLAYGTYASATILYMLVERNNLYGATFVNQITGNRVTASHAIVFRYMFANHGLLMCAFLLCTIMGVCVSAFFGYHVYLIVRGTTTNESYKWGLVSSYYKRRKKREKEAAAKAPVKGKRTEQGGDQNPKQGGGRYAPSKSSTPRPLEQRPDADFPALIPPNIYNRGIFANIMVVLRPPCEKRAAEAAAAASKKGH